MAQAVVLAAIWISFAIIIAFGVFDYLWKSEIILLSYLAVSLGAVVFLTKTLYSAPEKNAEDK